METVIAAAVLSAVLVGISFVLTPSNARYLLSGYNTLSAEEQQKVDISSLLKAFRRFNIALAFTLVLLVALSHAFFSPTVAGVVLVIYPVAGLGFFSWYSSRYFPVAKKRSQLRSAIIIGFILSFVCALLYLGLRNDGIQALTDRVVIGGMYPDEIQYSEISKIELVDALPVITYRSNGFALGGSRKGYFKTENGKVVKLYINGARQKYILIETISGMRHYYSDAKEDNKVLFERIRERWLRSSPRHNDDR
jgi:hypothetical protein